MSDFLRGLSPALAPLFARRTRQQTNEMCIDPAEYSIVEDDTLWVAQRVRTQRERARALMLDDDTIVQLNPTYVIGVVWREELEPEQPELWDVDEDESETDE